MTVCSTCPHTEVLLPCVPQHAHHQDEAPASGNIIDEVLARRKRKKKDDNEVDQEVMSLVSMVGAKACQGSTAWVGQLCWLPKLACCSCYRGVLAPCVALMCNLA